MKENLGKKILSLFLTISMVLTLIPAGLFKIEVGAAASDPIYVLAGGDYQQAGDHANSAENVTNILAQISQKYTTMDGFLFIGDYDCETHDSATETAAGIASLMDTVDNTYSNINHTNSVLVQGNHDYKDSNIDATGGHDFDGYSVYVLNEDDYPNGGGSQSQIQTLADNLEAWLNNKLGEGYDAPVFITSHLPLAFTPRTVTQGDAKYAKLIFDVLNTAADNGLNIIFLHGHDHAYGPDNYMGGEAVYLPEGDKIAIAETGSTSEYKWETLNFTYMNAGYTGYYSEPYTYVTDAGTDKLTMTVFKIENNQVTVERYSANGLYNLKSKGYDGSYSNTSVTNQTLGLGTLDTVYASPQTISLGTVETHGTIGEYIGVEAETPADDVATSTEGWVEIIAPIIPSEGADDVTTSGSDWVTLTEPSGGTTTYNYTWDTDGKNNDTAYLIVDGTSTTVLENNGTSGVTTATITSNKGATATATTQDYEWKIDSSNRIYTTINNTKYYLRLSISWGDSSLSLTTSTSDYSYDSATKWTISNNNGEYTISNSPFGDRGDTYYLTTSGLSTSTSTTNVTVRLYYADGSSTTGGSNGLYAYLKGDLTYTITDGMTAEQALFMVKDDIAIQYATASDYSDEQTYPNDGDGITWTLDSNYDPNVPGDYAVTIAYNGTTIGVAEVIVPADDPTSGTYYKIDGNLTYNATAGMTAEQALTELQSQISLYKYEGLSEPADSIAGTEDSDVELTYDWVDEFDGTTAGDYEIAIKYGDKLLGTAEVVVPATKTYYIAEGNGMYYVDMNTTADDALATVKAGVTVSSATDENGTNKQAIDDSLVTWKWIDTYNGADSGPYTVEILYNGTSLGTVEVKVNVKYETGINTDWTYIGETEATGGTHTYTLDTDGLDKGEEHLYIIVAESEDLALYATSTANSTTPSVTISSDGKTLTTTTRDYEYYFVDTYGFTKDGSKGLYGEDYYIRYGNRDGAYLDGVINNGNGYYTLWDNEGTYRGLTYTTIDNDTRFTVAEPYADQNVRLYKYTGSTGGTPAGSIYAKLEGNTVYTVDQGTSAYEALNAVKAGITGYISSNSDGSNPTELNDSDLKWTWKNTYTSMVTGSYWVEISYNGVVLGTVEVQVKPAVINNYPEYPDEGAVKVNKTGTGIDFQSSGIAQVEISASGVPLKKGIDVIVMVDTSSSMKSWCICGTQNCTQTGEGHARRNVIFEESLEQLISQLQAKNDDGTDKDIRVALADFNGFNGYNNSTSYGTPYDRTENDTTNDTNWYSATNQAKIYTGDGTLTAGAFVQAKELSTDSSTYNFSYVSGTNYDYAFDAIYQLGHSIKKANQANGENRDLYVIFMSDGAPMQYNYYHSQGASTNWQYWLTGTVEDHGGFSTVVRCQDHIHYYDENNGNKHRMAQAVKGDVGSSFEVIRKSTTGLEDVLTPTNEENMYMLPGLGATMFSIAFDPVADGNTPASAMTHVLEDIASEATDTAQYYYLADSADDLNNAFNSIGNQIAYAATNARFVDQMGDDYNLQMGNLLDLDNEQLVDKDGNVIENKIEIISYDIYTRQDYLNGTITEDKIGDRKGTYTILETVTFNVDGTEAYSDQVGGGTTNILADGTQEGYVKGVIYAKTFLYNTNTFGVAIEGVNIPTGVNSDGTTKGNTNVLPSETFYWKLGTVQTSELAMRYYVYLEGSMEGTREAGSYPTNEYATLYYDNYLGNPCYKETVSPVMAWASANVSYAFYLVDENGNIIVNQTTGQTGSFANKIAVTNPVVYEEILLNNIEQVSSINVASSGVLPTGYELYDAASVYTIKIDSDSTGEWTITKGEDTVASTYVTNYNPDNAAAYTNELTSKDSADYTHTVVWFAVLWKVQALPDTVVIDYGLPVDISVLANDMFGENGKLAGVGAYSDSLKLDGYDTNLASGFGSSYTGTYGVAKTDTSTGKVRYTLNESNGMQMQAYEKFAYAVNYTGSTNAGYYYDTVTVIPATTVYFEDSFIKFEGKVNGEASDEVWNQEGTTTSDAIQAEDRPGFYSITDANNVYGYDQIYDNANMSQYSLGSAMKAHIESGTIGTATFSFWGTGFDVVGLTSNKTGVLVVQVYKYGETTPIKNYIVDTYYGYKYGWRKFVYTYNSDTESWDVEITSIANGDYTSDSMPENYEHGTQYTEYVCGWYEVDSSDPNAIYQVPVMRIESINDGAYGHYTVKITASYSSSYDHTEETGYDLYIDAVRIYNPTNNGLCDDETDLTIENAYKEDNESWPIHTEVRNHLISQSKVKLNLPEDLKECEIGSVYNLFVTDKMLGYEFTNPANNETITITEEHLNKPISILVTEDLFEVNGITFIDGKGNTAELADYKNYGPNNEVYLKAGDAISFDLNIDDSIVKDVQIGLKSADGLKSNCLVYSYELTEGENSSYYHEFTKELTSSTDMYYSIYEMRNGTIVIENNSDNNSIISITNIKVTYSQIPNGVSTTDLFSVSTDSTSYVLGRMNYVAPTTFAPEVFEVTLDETVEVGTDVNVNVTTSTDVEYIYVNDTIVTTYVEENDLRTFTTTLPTTEVGTLEVYVKAYNVDGLESETECYAEVIVTEKTFTPETFKVSTVDTAIIGSKVLVTVSTSNDVDYITVNGEKVTTYRTSKFTGLRTWTLSIPASVVGELNVEVVAYDSEDTASETITNTVTVKEIKTIIEDIFGWLFG